MAERHFDEQRRLAKGYLIPFFDAWIPEWRRYRVLEVGCAEGGVIEACHELGIRITGLEIAPHRIKNTLRRNPCLDIRIGDITDPTLPGRIDGPYGLVILRDVIEHVTDREAMMGNLVQLLSPRGYLFITFPPRLSPFAGHQQHLHSFLRFTPYLHLCPGLLLRPLSKLLREDPTLIDGIRRQSRIGLTISTFRGLMRRCGFSPLREMAFLIRPVYAIRFGWKPRQIPMIPGLSEFLALGFEWLGRKNT